MESLLKIEKLVKVFSLGGVEVKALNGVSFEIRKGEFVSIWGPSGSGKSTLLNLVGGLEKPTSGQITMAGEEEQVGFVFQAFNLLPRLSALKNVALPLIYAGVSFGERTRQAKEELEAVGLGGKLNHRPNQLSPLEQQKVALARALVTHPSLILADEPTGNLDSQVGAEIMSLLEKLNRLGKSVLLATHEKSLAEHAERTIHLFDGKIVADKKVRNRRSAIKAVIGEV